MVLNISNKKPQTFEAVKDVFINYLQQLNDPEKNEIFQKFISQLQPVLSAQGKNYYSDKFKQSRLDLLKQSMRMTSGKEYLKDLTNIMKLYTTSPIGIFTPIISLEYSDIYIGGKGITLLGSDKKEFLMPDELKKVYYSVLRLFIDMTSYASGIAVTKFDKGNAILDYNVMGLRFNVTHSSLSAVDEEPIVVIRKQLIRKDAQFMKDYIDMIGIDKNTQGILRNIAKNESWMILGVTGSGKALSNDMPVLTENGWQEIGSLKVGDKVWTPKGELTSITGVYPQGKKEVYLLKTMEGQSVECSKDHLWSVYTDQRPYNSVVLTTKNIIDSLTQNINYYLPRCTKTLYNKLHIPFKDIAPQIDSIEDLGIKKEMTCIKVADKDELFITRDYIVTHNTTLAKWMSSQAMSVRNNLITIEDTPELHLGNTIAYLTSDKYGINDMFKNALRQNPDEIIIGESRGSEVLDLLQNGLVFPIGTTIHASSLVKCVSRIVFMIKNDRPDFLTEDIYTLIKSTLSCFILMENKKVKEIWLRDTSKPFEAPILDGFYKCIYKA